MIDVHAHILPGMDDGPSAVEESVEMVRIAVQNGIRTIIATPHCLNGVYINWRQEILSACQELNTVLEKQHIDFTILPGSEVHLSPEILGELKRGRLMTINDKGSYFFLELPHQFMAQPILRFIYQLKSRKVTPLITHPERNMAIQRDIGLLSDLIDSGALSQITGGSLTGDFGIAAQKCCRKIIKMNMAHFMASDAHSPKLRPPNLSAAVKKLYSLAGKEKAEKIMFEAPLALADGRDVLRSSVD